MQSRFIVNGIYQDFSNTKNGPKKRIFRYVYIYIFVANQQKVDWIDKLAKETGKKISTDTNGKDLSVFCSASEIVKRVNAQNQV